MEARIIRDDGTDANVNEPGDLWLRGNNAALGYWNNEKANKETFVDGWVHTGDKFYADADCNFWLVSIIHPLFSFLHIKWFVHTSSDFRSHLFRYADRTKVRFSGTS